MAKFNCWVARLAQLVGGSLAMVGSAFSQTTVNIAYLEGQVPAPPDAIATYGAEMFGDRANLYGGTLEFQHTDMLSPGNSKLEVALRRRHTAGRDSLVRGQLGDWDLDTPRIGGTYSSGIGWVTYFGGTDRCSQFTEPPPHSSGVDARDYWQGVQLNVPGSGSQEVLKRSGSYAGKPTDGANYPLVTHQNWQISCLTQGIQNGSGEGFIAVSPDGVRYRFDWMATRSQTNVRSRIKVGATGRVDIFLMATEVTDRHGNRVTYTYDPAAPMNLLRVEGNDGRFIALTYSGGKLASAFDGTRTFTYSYDAFGDLQYAVQPDGSRWTFNLRPMVAPKMPNIGEGADCNKLGDVLADGDVQPGVIIHPSGATGTFNTQFRLMGIAYVPQQCIKPLNYSVTQPRTVGAYWPRTSSTQVLLSKQISGPGMLTETWTYEYAGKASWSSCTSDCGGTRTVTVTHPDGSMTRHVFGNLWHVNEGQLQQTDEGWDGASALRTTVYRYRDPTATAQNFPDQFGLSVYNRSDWLSTRHRPQDKAVVTQQGVTFTWEANGADFGFDSKAAFDGFARPVLVKKSSSLGFAKTESTVFEDNFGKWVLGQRKSLTNLSAGAIPESYDYDSVSALKTASYAFSRKTLGFNYNADGTVSTLFDAANRPILFQNFMRGKPQRAVFADGTVASRVVNNLGNVAASTNEVPTTTSFTFDFMGRVASVIPPVGNTTYQVFEPVGSYEFGLPPGHWRQTVSTGTGVTSRYFDAQWRVRLLQKYDTDDTASTSFVETRYDAKGRKSFESYPQAGFAQVDDATVPGKYFDYDALDRPIAQRADSELGVLTTTTRYLGGFQKEVTNPRGHATTYQFQAFDTPSEEHISQTRLPDGSWLSIVRDPFGAATSITRGGTYAGAAQQAMRSYFYDANHRLCKTVEPETGATLQGYDAAGNVAWRVSGLPASQLRCDQDTAPPSRTTSFGYDPRDRLTSTTFGDGQPSISRTYTADGLLQQLASSSFTWTYSYDARRLLTQEAFSVPGQTPGAGWNFSYTLDGNGHVATLTDPWGSINYSPNALGQPRQVSGYASGVKYHANGMVSDYTLANGITHRVKQNKRGLPEEWQDGSANFDVYSYDANGNVMGIQDMLPGGIHRVMQPYDPLDRLKEVTGAWGTARYDYDALDNLRSSQVGSRSLTHSVEPATNRLSALSGSQQLPFAYDANGNVTQRGGQTFSFDIANRMRVAQGKASYDYDGHGRRSWVVFANGSTQLNAYSGTGAVGRLMFSNHSVKGGTRYVYLGGKLIAEHNNLTGVSYSHTDALGSVVARSNAAGQLQGTKTRYEPYGATALGDVPQSIGFTGHVNDADTGLVYMQQRYYEPLAGRFLSVDPVVTDQKTGGHFGRYHYASNNPFQYIDPDGRAVESVVNGEIRGADTTMNLAKEVVRPARASTEAIVLHRTVSSNANSAIASAVNSDGKASFHIVIDKDGKTTQIANLSNVANHVGKPTGSVSNQNSIGIEVVGNYDADKKAWEPLTPAQVQATAKAVNVISAAYGLKSSQVVTHESVSRKTAGEGLVVLDAIRTLLNKE